MERVMGIEPTLFAWEARVLPLNDTREGVDYRARRMGTVRPEKALIIKKNCPLSLICTAFIAIS